MHFRWSLIPKMAGLFIRRQALQGKYLEEFTRAFSAYIGSQNAIPVASARIALFAILKSLNKPAGKNEVILSAYEDLSVPKMIEEAGFSPVFCDIRPGSHNIDLDEVKGRITNKTAAIIIAHLFGIPCDPGEIRSLAKERGITLIEDCAHAVGTTLGGRHVGTFGDAAIFSFYPTKTFMCFGGGMLVASDPELFGRAKQIVSGFTYPRTTDLMLRIAGSCAISLLSRGPLFWALTFPALNICAWLGWEPLEIYDRGFRRMVNTKTKAAAFTNVQALAGTVNLRHYNAELQRRRENAALLDRLLDPSIRRQRMTGEENCYFFIVYSREREKIQACLLRNGIDTGKSLMRNCPRHFNSTQDYPGTTTAIDESIQIPIHENLSSGKIAKMAAIINRAFRKIRPLH